ncbi:glycosyl transferase family 2 [Flavobacterium columnare]|uniref:glycosyltransferase n=1 Tax=Flavobacterium columnare TaxID=996 RepID=UPI0009819AF8|nr:glycosyltransferase [Flavobacterium columnare]MBF6651644.1 glycosyl transferase family 2 [Flavobacterium columnare]MBF6654770.1 glycosyl transferase family 2 [Flavobacterium columnare]MBF6657381.1 glycosyl transferase family 2 [Flavobacterium columnare]OOB82489.1 glycosyl transferase family 2 [Flavobacterium columnare]PTD16289.1 glycosyl transferase family 2 [Flavobacterium columnare]
MELFLLILFYFFLTVVVIQIIYYLFVFGKFSFTKPQESKEKHISVSVIVCAKNEEENLTKLIPLLAKQNYPNYEIVIIDDASYDNTRFLVEDLQKEIPNLKLVKVENNEAFWGNKKFALTLGIKAASKEYLLFTDADCFPNSENWIKEMSSHFTMHKTIVLGYGAYEKKPSFLNKLIRFETLLTATQYFSWAKLGKPYMGVGRNLAYKREEFFRTNGFINHIKVRSGDDDLFINEAANNSNTTICFSTDSFTYSVPKQTFGEWFTQKRRHASTAKLYKAFDKNQLALFYLSQFFFFTTPITLLAMQYQWIIVLSAIAVRYLSSWISLGFSAGKLEEKDVIYWYPILEIILIFTQLNVFIRNLISKPVTWK